MIRLTPQRKYHVSNRLAVIAALVLALSSYVGSHVGFTHDVAFDRELAPHAIVAVSDQDDQAADPAVKKRKLNISLLLFGRG